MLVYNIILVFGVLCSLMSRNIRSKYIRLDNGEIVRTTHLGIAFLTFSGCIVFFGLRSGFADTWAYIANFEAMPLSYESFSISLSTKERFFSLYTYYFKNMINNYHWWLFSIALFQSIAILSFTRKYSRNFTLSFLYFFLSLTFSWMINGMRQFIAVTILLYAVEPILQKKYIKFLLISFIACQFHQSALIGCGLMVFAAEKVYSKKTLLVGFGIVLATAMAAQFTSLLNTLLQSTAYASATNQFANDDGVNVLRVVVSIAPTLLYLYLRPNSKKPVSSIDAFCLNMSLFGAGFYLLGTVTSGILVGRIPIYFTIFNMITIPFMLETLPKKNEKQLFKIAFVTFYFLYYVIFARNYYYISDFLGLLVL